MSVKSDESALARNILQTEKQMFCAVCMKFMCSIHFYENSRVHYSSWTSCNYKAVLASYRNFLTITYNTYKSELTLLGKVVEKIDKLNEYVSGKKGSKTFGKVHKIDMENLKYLVSLNKYLQNPCDNRCFVTIQNEAELCELTLDLSSVASEYLNKLIEIYKFQPCKISAFLNIVLLNNKEEKVTCKGVRVAFPN